MKAGEKLEPADLVYEIANIGSMMESILDVVKEMDFSLPNGERNIDLDRIYAMQTITVDYLSHLAEGIKGWDGPRRFVPYKTSAIPSDDRILQFREEVGSIHTSLHSIDRILGATSISADDHQSIATLVANAQFNLNQLQDLVDGLEGGE